MSAVVVVVELGGSVVVVVVDVVVGGSVVWWSRWLLAARSSCGGRGGCWRLGRRVVVEVVVGGSVVVVVEVVVGGSVVVVVEVVVGGSVVVVVEVVVGGSVVVVVEVVVGGSVVVVVEVVVGGSVVVVVEVVVGGSVVVVVEVVVGGSVVVVVDVVVGGSASWWSSRCVVVVDVGGRGRRGRGGRLGDARRGRRRCGGWSGRAGSFVGEAEPARTSEHVELREAAIGVRRGVDRERRRTSDLRQRGGIDGVGRIGIEGVFRRVEGERLRDRGRAAIVAHQYEAKEPVSGSEEEFRERLRSVEIRIDRLSVAVTDLLERVFGQIGLVPGECVEGAAGIDALEIRGLGRAGDIGRSHGLWQISRQFVFAAVRDRQIDGREWAFLRSRVGDGLAFLGDPHELLTG